MFNPQSKNNPFRIVAFRWWESNIINVVFKATNLITTQKILYRKILFFYAGMAQIGSSKNSNEFQKQQPSLRAAGNAAA